MQPVLLALLLVCFSGNAFARGGSCNSALCNATAAIVFLVLLFAVVVSVVASVRRHGLVTGLLRHRGLQFALFYVALLIVCAVGSVIIGRHFGKEAAMWFLGGLAVVALIVYCLLPSGSQSSVGAPNRNQAASSKHPKV
jgi:hypothetical protein